MKGIKLKITIVLAIFVFFTLCLIVQAFWLQIIDVSKFKKGFKKVIIPCKRGVIYDRHGEPLAITVQTPSLYACPDLIDNPKKIAKILSPIIKIDEKELLKKLKRKGEFIWLKRWLSAEEVKKLERLNIKGLGFRLENRRYYPHSFLAGQVLGFVGIDGKGLEGIERKFDKFLVGKDGYYYGLKDARGYISLSPRHPIKPAEDGASIYLSLDYKIQYAVEESLKKAIKKWQARAGSVIVLVPQTGEILAMANYPFFDPNHFRNAYPYLWRNHAIADVFEPGSTFKVVLLAAALNENIWTPHDILYGEKGKYCIENAVFHDVKPFGWLSVEHTIIYSSNIGAIKIGEKIGKNCFYKYIKKFGFGEKTGIDLDGEANGLIRPAEQWTAVDTAAACFGQGIAITALQLALAYAAIANNGKLMRPIIVKSIRNFLGKEIMHFSPEIKRQVISKKTASQIKKILRKVVLKGTGQEAEIAGYNVAGKTGTAQKIDLETGRYSSNKHIASFVGFFPVENPRVVIAVIIDEPRPVSYGGIVAAPVFKEIAEYIIWQWQLPPSSRIVRVVKNEDKLIKESQKIYKNKEKIAVSNGIMPDLHGLSLRQAMKILQKVKIKVKIKGSGIVVKQNPVPGTHLKEGMICLLELGAD
ncbi:MAG: transpeptidase family protein [Candidatus Desulfofervidus auxilii]|nr:transpeptidase family protein [Candidatus Desulfofervidus auxilii]